MDDVHLEGALLSNARFNGATIFSVDFSGAYLEDVDFIGSDIRVSKFDGADLRRSDFTGAFAAASFKNALLDDAQLTAALMTFSNFTGASLQRANLRGLIVGSQPLPPSAKVAGPPTRFIPKVGIQTAENFLAADLRGAHLGQADLKYTEMKLADLTGSDALTPSEADWVGINASIEKNVPEDRFLHSDVLNAARLRVAYAKVQKGTNPDTEHLDGAIVDSIAQQSDDKTQAYFDNVTKIIIDQACVNHWVANGFLNEVLAISQSDGKLDRRWRTVVSAALHAPCPLLQPFKDDFTKIIQSDDKK
jgi:uncharacterized protein YjbI with pentapeptide repeats